MKSVRAATCILMVGLLATVCPAANPIPSFGYPAVLPQQPQARPDVRVAALGFRGRRAAPVSTPVSEGCADYGSGCADDGATGTVPAYPQPNTTPVQTIPVQTPAAVSAPAATSIWGTPSNSLSATMASCNAPTSYSSGSQFTSGGWSGCAPIELPSCGPTWFGGVYGLAMEIYGDRDFWVATTDADPDEFHLNTNDVDDDVAGGVELRFGKAFNGGRWAMEFVYWGIYPETSRSSLSSYDVVGNLVPTLDFSNLILPNAAAPGVASIFEVSRTYELNNFEFNLLSGPLMRAAAGCDVGCGSRWTTNWLLGFRYLQFDESLRIIYENGDGVIDRDAPFVVGNNDQIYYDVETENDLAGIQLGVDADYALSKRLRLDLASRFGVYGNRASQSSRIFNSWGDADSAISGDAFNVQSSSDNVSFLGELRLGLSYLMGPHWRLTGGYRAVAATGIARAMNQIPLGNTLHAVDQVRGLDRDGSLVVHGGYLGAEFGW